MTIANDSDLSVMKLLFRLCLFWVKITSGNAFPEMRLFGWSGKFYFPEIEIRWPKKKKPLTTEIILHFYFPFKVFLENEWERERESVRARSRSLIRADRDLVGKHSSRRWSRRDRVVDRDLAFARSHRIEIAIDGAISRRRWDRDRAVNRDLRSRSTARSSDGVQCRRWWFFPGLWLVFF